MGFTLANFADDFGDTLSKRAKEIKHNADVLKWATSQAIEDLKMGGTLSRQLAGYRERPSQIQMVRAVSIALLQSKHAIIEAPTGVGKSLAYLIPVVRAGVQSIVSTSNKALQNQLYGKDVPFLQKYLQPFNAVLVKGKKNYICLDRLQKFLELEQEGTVNDAMYKHLVEAVEKDDFDGDLANLTISLTAEVQENVTVDEDQCTWKKCNHYEDCYLRKLKEKAAAADVIITNHSLLLLDALTDGRILPARDTVIIDEAHGLEGVATDVFTKKVKPSSITNLLSLSLLKKYSSNKIQDEIDQQAKRLWALLESRFVDTDKSKLEIDQPIEDGLKLASMVSKLARELESKQPQNMTDKDNALYKKLQARVENTADTIKAVFSVAKQNEYVYFLETVRAWRHKKEITQIEIARVPLSVSLFLKESLYKDKVIIATSATISTQGNFNFFKSRMGIDEEVIQQILKPVFNYPDNALLYLPTVHTVPEPAYDQPQRSIYEKAIAEEMKRLVDASEGRAFLLFSSKRMQEVVYQQIGTYLESRYDVFYQREGTSNAAIISSFKQSTKGVLFGLKSFWEGVDIAGDTLSLVVIDKLPFVPADDPVQRARVRKINEQASSYLDSAFNSYIIPQIVIQLKQGVGRLIRTEKDRGVMAILDTRLSTKSYGRTVKASLPPAKQTNRIDDVKLFFRRDVTQSPAVAAAAAADHQQDDNQLIKKLEYILSRVQTRNTIYVADVGKKTMGMNKDQTLLFLRTRLINGNDAIKEKARNAILENLDKWERM